MTLWLFNVIEFVVTHIYKYIKMMYIIFIQCIRRKDLLLPVSHIFPSSSPQGMLPPRACAAAGQSGLMSLYEAMFAQYGMRTAQVSLGIDSKQKLFLSIYKVQCI